MFSLSLAAADSQYVNCDIFPALLESHTADTRYAAAADACGWSTFYTDCNRDYTHPTPECEAATQKATKYIPSPIDPFDVLAPACVDQGDGEDAVARLAPGLARLGLKVIFGYGAALGCVHVNFGLQQPTFQWMHVEITSDVVSCERRVCALLTHTPPVRTHSHLHVHTCTPLPLLRRRGNLS